MATAMRGSVGLAIGFNIPRGRKKLKTAEQAKKIRQLQRLYFVGSSRDARKDLTAKIAMKR
jgi:hypothetical protein